MIEKKLPNNLSEDMVLAFMRTRLTPTERKDFVERCQEISELENRFVDGRHTTKSDSEGTTYIGCVDNYVNHELMTAIRCYKISAFNATIVFLGATVEEELARLYKLKNGTDVPRNWTGWNLLVWAVFRDIVKDEEKIGLNSIIFARNYFAHATVIMQKKTRKKIEKGEMNEILPTDVEIPEFAEAIINYWEKIPGIKIDRTKPKLGWLETKECALKAIELVISFICRTSKEYPSEAVLKMMEMPPPWKEEEK